MSQINPLVNSILQSPNAQRAAAAEKERQIRRIHDLQKNAALEGDQLQHEVESSEEVSAVQDDAERKRAPRRGTRKPAGDTISAKTDGDEHLDITA